MVKNNSYNNLRKIFKDSQDDAYEIPRKLGIYRLIESETDMTIETII